MLNIKEYSEKIDNLHEEGKSAFEISKILNFKYCQPVYNYFKKKDWSVTKREDYKWHTKYTVNHDFFDQIDTEEKAYILGFICADGHIDRKKGCIVIALQDSDYKILEKIRSCLNSNHPIVRNIQRKNPYTKANHLVTPQCAITISGKKLVAPLFNMGLNNRKTYTLDSTIMKYLPENLIRHFLRGYFDGDGNIVWKKHYSSGNKYLIQVAGNKDFLLSSFQKYFPTQNVLYKYKTSKQCYVWKVSDRLKVLEFLNYIYSDAKIYLDRKYKIYKYAMWSFKTELIAGNSYFINLIKGQSAAKPLVKSFRKVQRLADETIKNPYEEEIEYNSATNAQHQELHNNLDEDIVRTI